MLFLVLDKHYPALVVKMSNGNGNHVFTGLLLCALHSSFRPHSFLLVKKIKEKINQKKGHIYQIVVNSTCDDSELKPLWDQIIVPPQLNLQLNHYLAFAFTNVLILFLAKIYFLFKVVLYQKFSWTCFNRLLF